MYLAPERPPRGAVCFHVHPLPLRALRRSDCAAEETVSLQNDTNRADARKPSGLDKRWVICTSIHITLLLDCTTLSAALASEALSCYHCSLYNVPSCAISALCDSLCDQRTANETGLMKESRYRTGNQGLSNHHNLLQSFHLVCNQ